MKLHKYVAQLTPEELIDLYDELLDISLAVTAGQPHRPIIKRYAEGQTETKKAIYRKLLQTTPEQIQAMIGVLSSEHIH